MAEFVALSFAEVKAPDKILEDIKSRQERLSKGGQGSGNFGHAGRPGEQGGSSAEAAPGGVKDRILRDQIVRRVQSVSNRVDEFESGITRWENADPEIRGEGELDIIQRNLKELKEDLLTIHSKMKETEDSVLGRRNLLTYIKENLDSISSNLESKKDGQNRSKRLRSAANSLKNSFRRLKISSQ